MKKLNKKQKTLVIVLSVVLITPLIIFSILRETGAFDLRSNASSTLTEEFKKADLNNDDKITIADFSIWLTSYRNFKENGKCPTGAICTQVLPIGDLNADGQVSIADFSMWLNLWRAYKGKGQDGNICKDNSECASNVCSTFCSINDTSKSIKVCGKSAPSGYGTLCSMVECSPMLWWFDNDSKVCNKKSFCGDYMYPGLQTFGTEAECKSALSGCSMLWWFDSSTVADTTTCHQKEFCGEYMYKNLFVFENEAACNITLSQFQPSGTNDCIYSPSNVTNYYKCIANFCTLNGGTWVDNYYECENISEKVCSAKNGIFTSCASSCRHFIEENPGVTDVMCTQECVDVCNLSVK